MAFGDVLDFIITYIDIKEEQEKHNKKSNGNNKEKNVKSTKFSYGKV